MIPPPSDTEELSVTSLSASTNAPALDLRKIPPPVPPPAVFSLISVP